MTGPDLAILCSLASKRAEGDCQNISCRALRSCRLASSISVLNRDVTVFKVAASRGSRWAAGEAKTDPAENDFQFISLHCAEKVLSVYRAQLLGLHVRS